jgi:DNA polymerase-1
LLIYGLGPASLARKARIEYGVPMTEDEARGYRDAFFRTYPALQAWHRRLARQGGTETRTILGRSVQIERDASPGKRANYAVQGTGGDGIKMALALLWERRAECPSARPILVVHDEVVLEVPADHAEAAAAWLRRAMLDGMAPLIDPVPLDVVPEIIPTWGG